MMRKLLYSFLFFIFLQFTSFGQKTFTANSGNNWTTSANWSPAGMPGVNDDVIIGNGQNVTINTAAVCRTFVINGGNAANTVTISGANSLTVSGAITINTGTNSGNNKIIDVGDGTLSSASITMQATGNTNRVSRININNGTVNVAGNVTLSTNNSVNFTGNGVLFVEGNMSGGTLVAPSGTVNYSGTVGQTVGNYTYNNLTMSGSGTKTANGNIVVNGALSTVAGAIFNMSTFQLTGTLSSIANVGTIRTQNTNATPIPTGKNWGGIVQYDGAGQTVSTGTYNNLILSGTATKTLGGGSTVNANLTIGSGVTLAGNNNSLTIGGDFTSSGTFTHGTSGTVTLNGANQSFNVSTFNNLTLAGTGTKSFTGTSNVSGALIINSGVNANLGTVTHVAGSLTLGAAAAATGSWGSTASLAQNTNNVFFTSTTGMISVTPSSCTTFSSVAPITNVLFGSINNGTPSTSTANYIYYSGVTAANVTKGQYYELTVRGSSGGGGNGYFSVFFDLNGNGSFADAGEGPFKIGTINNSNGNDGKATSLYYQIPTTATAGLTRMRIMSRSGTDYNTNSCAISGSTGQIQDYNINILEACVGNVPGGTLTTATSVCPGTAFTLSLENQMAEGTTYIWQTSPDGNAPWTGAAPNPTPFFSSTFSTNVGANGTDGDITLYGAETTISGGELNLTTLVGGYIGGAVIQKTLGRNVNAFSAAFDYKIYGGDGADGLSLSYAPNINNNAGGGESGEGTGLILQLDTYDNEGVQTGSRVRITYNNNNNVLFNSAINAPFNLRTSSLKNVLMSVNDKGYLTLTIDGTIVVSNLLLPAAYLAADKSTWKFKFSARTGGSNDRHIIDNVNINFLDITNSKPTFTTTQTVKTYYRVQTSCGSTILFSTPVMVDVTSATISPITRTICSATSTTITPANGGGNTIPTGTTYTWPIPVMTSGLTGGSASSGAPTSLNTGTLTVSTGTTTPQTATYTVTPVTGSCNGVPFTVTVTVNPIQATPSTTNKINVTCSELGKVTLGSLPAGNWQINQSGQATATITGTGASYEVTGLVAGSYTFTVETATSCVSAATPAVVITDVPVVTWTASGWVNGPPDSTKKIIISSNVGTPFPSSTPVVNGCSLTIDPTINVTVQSGVTLVITNAVTTNGTLTFKTNSSLVQTTNATNTGSITYERETNVRRYDLTYWSTPVTNTSFKLSDLSPATLGDKYFIFDPNSGWIINYNGTQVMETGKGYSVRAPQPYDINIPALFTGKFTGIPNNGDINPTVVSGTYNLVGNPYPSAISAVALINGNTNLGTIYLWTHNTLPQGVVGDNKYYYTSDDYAAFNLTGSAQGSAQGALLNGQPFQEYIAAGQGFLAQPKTATMSFNNTMRRNGNNQQFYKTTESVGFERNRVWLNLSNDQGAFKQALIGYIEGATNGLDINYDAGSLEANPYVDFYSVNEANKLTIQGRALPFDNKDVVPLGYNTTVAGEFTIAIDRADGFFDTQEVYLEDLLAGKTVNLRDGNYKFTTAVGTFENRFNLRYTSKTLGTGEFEDLDNSVLVSVKNKVVKISSSKETLKEVNVYNAGAQLLYNKNKVNSNDLQISNLNSSDQVLLVKVTLENGHTLTKKVVFSNL